MKSFNEFKEMLTYDVVTEIHNKAMDYASKMIDENFSDENGIQKSISHERYYNTYVTFCMLEKYHEWLNG